MSEGTELITLAIDLHAFGSRKGPRAPRSGIDLLPRSDGRIGPESPPFPAGVSTFANPGLAPLSGHYHKLPRGTTLPAGLAVLADGVDVNPDSTLPATHHTIYPVDAMAGERFIELFLQLPWVYAGKNG